MLIKGKIKFKVELYGEVEETMKFPKEELEKLEKKHTRNRYYDF